jgi:orotidine-5'-phosphate decarboxylase
VLTDIDADECLSIFGDTPGKKVQQFARFLVDYGADGVICAPAEGLLLRQDSKFNSLEIATPNVRPPWTMTEEERARVNDDQDIKRQLTPAAAVRARIDKIVIGRPITNPSPEIGGPVKAAKLIAQQMAEVTGEEP